MKIVVFDLDETLGYFTQFGIFWDSLKHYTQIKNKPQLTQNAFNNVLDLFPEYLRPNILNILLYLKNKKTTNCCNKILIYTNNNGPREWANQIIHYFESKIHFKLIDQIIAAFKINGRQIEICRTTHTKTHNDLIKCTKIPEDTEICFIDDCFYPEMTNDNIYYINIKPYYYDLNFDYMLNKFIESDFGKSFLSVVDEAKQREFIKLMNENIELFHYKVIEKNKKEYEIDHILGRHIISHLNKFFNNSNKKTIKNKGRKLNKTKKHNK
jgi:hypothetical protein